jgi:hypothetical protein
MGDVLMSEKMYPIDFPTKEMFLAEEGDDREIVSHILTDIESVREHFESLFIEGEENVRFYKPEQWTEEEKEAHENQGRRPYEINEVHSKINHLVGTQTNTRLDAKAEGRDRQDSSQAEILTALIKWAEHVNNVDVIQTEVFRQSLLRGASAAKVGWEFKDVVYGRPIVERVPIYQLYWDINAREITLEDARWMARVIVMDRQAVIDLFPDLKDTIESIPGYSDNLTQTQYGFRPNHIERIGTLSDLGRKRREMLEVIEHYERITSYRYVVVDDIEGTEFAYEDKREAEDYYEFLISRYEDGGAEMYYADLSPKVSLNVAMRDTIIQSIVVGEQVVSRQLTALPRFPFIVNFCYFEDGDHWAFTSYLKDPQRLVNRSISQWDYQLGKAIQNLITLQMAMFPRGSTYDGVVDQLQKTAPVLSVLDHRAIQTHPSQGAQPELFKNIDFAIGRMQEYAGGRNSLGLQESAAESGRAVLARSEQAGIGKLPLFDNLRVWRTTLTEMLVWFMKNFMQNQQIIQIIGGDDHIAFEPIDDGVLETLREQRYNIIVTEAQDTDSVRVEQFEQLVKMASQFQLPPEIIQTLLIELSSLPQSTKDKLIEQMEFHQAWAQQKAQESEQAQMQKSIEDAMKKQQMRQEMETNGGTSADAQSKQEADLLQLKLDNFEKMQMEFAKNNLSPTEKDSLYNKVREPGDVAAAQKASVQGAMGMR